MQAVGVNAIAARAGVSKVLIYRYFSDIHGLFRAVAERLAERGTAPVDVPAGLGDGEPFRRFVRDVLVNTHTALDEDAVTKRIMVQELGEDNELTRAIAAAREARGLRITAAIREAVSAEVDFEALVAVVSSSIFFLTLKSDRVRMFNGIDLHSEEGWNRICDTLAGLVDAFLGSS